MLLGVAVCVRMAHPDDYGPDDAVFAEELAGGRAAVCIDNARRFTRERTTALALQHSLLPRDLPARGRGRVAHRYLPCGSLAGVGGDWFDVIPLSGGRVGLVVGDVVGHGIQSSATTAGRLRTAVRTLADVDLPPTNLTHLDDLVPTSRRRQRRQVAELGATCPVRRPTTPSPATCAHCRRGATRPRPSSCPANPPSSSP
ncbi:SpoIIE family protein phosphatase [Streptomyces tricolor]|nr:SpoIIE family protein phosphatase [Streptomyces tricolor]